MSHPRAVGLLVSALRAMGCRRDPASRDAEDRLAAQRAIVLPSVAATGLAAPGRGVRVLVGPSALDVDGIDLFASWSEKRRARLLHELPEEEAASLPFIHRGLVRFTDGRIAMPDTPAP